MRNVKVQEVCRGVRKDYINICCRHECMQTFNHNDDGKSKLSPECIKAQRVSSTDINSTNIMCSQTGGNSEGGGRTNVPSAATGCCSPWRSLGSPASCPAKRPHPSGSFPPSVGSSLAPSRAGRLGRPGSLPRDDSAPPQGG